MSNRKDAMANIVLILSDQHNRRFMGCAGHPVVRTPALDRLASQGTRFTSAYCPNPLCVPSRMGFLAGRHPGDVDVWDNGSVLDSSVPTFAGAFASAGWESVLCGRMHFDGPDQFHGFSRRIFGDCNDSLATEILGQGRKRTNGQTAYAVQVAGHGRTGFQAFDREVTSRAVEFLRQRRAGDGPFCLVVGYMLPHNPLICRRDLFEHYMDVLPPLQLPDRQQIARLHPAIRAWRQRRDVDDLAPQQHRRALAAYCGLVTEMDENIGRLLSAVDDSPLADDTLVVYCSDHGDMASEHGLWWKSLFYEGSAGVPLIFRWPGRIAAGRTIDAVVNLIDVGPTLLELAGAPAMPSATGRSLAGLLPGRPVAWRDETFCEYVGDHGDQPACMIRRGRWKLMYYSEFDSCLLFDLETDPDEQHDLAGDPACRQVVAELLAEVHARWSVQRVREGVARQRQRWQQIRHDPPTGPHPVEHHRPRPEDNFFDRSQLAADA